MKSVILISNLLLLSGCATTGQQGQAVSPGSAVGTNIENKDQPCHLPSSKSSHHRHTYDEMAYLKRISYNH